MKTKSVPAIVMLLGGAVRCIIGIIMQEKWSTSYAFSLLMVLIVFYIIGLVVQFILRKNIPEMVEDVTPSSEENLGDEAELENIQNESVADNPVDDSDKNGE